MAARAVKRFRIREVITAKAPSVLPSAAPSLPVPQLQSVTKPSPFQAPQQPFQFQYPFQFQSPDTASDSGAATESQDDTQVDVPIAPKHVPRRTNPFVPQLNPKTGKWAPPKYSLRQQADLIKKARKTGMLDLLPPGTKTNKARERLVVAQAAQPVVKVQAVTGETSAPTNPRDEGWQRPVEWVGKVTERKVAGAEIGNRLYAGRKRMFKGHKWERLAEKRAIRRKMLLRDMPKRIARYKQYYRRRRPNPLKLTGTPKNAKLPF
ncbi:hypothetical protein BKA82DRAFT_470491 [Pisolithus tinctorius]|uniref:Large ribosomal subunit protein mL59 domain-containing protein n=1 Tax=Pisolithus tinctorius Marx 270 TaxID=870435 RepID=A0A0C3PXN3_PISTI|nr:hypothetical protein BKA82DRAFT_470491 [Pisolithus tinctorius]KIO14231.1 hypothetical protein M404DRAFT_470491 [Pisolithus tinctorius Marx 270]